MTVFLPPADNNPYLRLLAAHLRAGGVASQTMPVALNLAWLHSVPPGILHFHWPSFGYTHPDRDRMREYTAEWAALLAAAKGRGCKIVWTAHNLYPHEQMHHDLEREARQALLNACDAVILHCSAAAALLESHFGYHGRWVVIPHGHFREVYGAPAAQAEARVRLSLATEGRIYLFFGQLRPYKGLDRLLRLMPKLDATVLIAGATVSAEFARRLLAASRAIPNLAVHPFFIPDSEVPLYFGACDAVVLPYADVLTSGAAILAHSMERPVIAPHLGCLPEIVPPGTGWLYDPADDEGLGWAMEASQRDAATVTAAECLATALRHDWTKAAARTADLYRALA